MCSPQNPMVVSCGSPIKIHPQRSSSRTSLKSMNRPMTAPAAACDQGPCYFHPRNDCCVPCCKPLPRCPLGTFVRRTLPIRPDRLPAFSDAVFSGLTTYKEHYHLKCGPRALSFKPQTTFDPSNARMDGISTYRDAYYPKPLLPYKKPSWAKKAQFDPSCAPMAGISTYRNDYAGCRGERVKSLKPLSQFDPSCAAMDGYTTYRTNYIPYCPREYRFAKQPLAKRKTGGDISCAAMNGISTYRADYWPKAIIKVQSLKPSVRAAFSDAPFADRTTYRNDYNPFTFEQCCGPCIPAEVYDSQYPACGIFACGADDTQKLQPPVYEDPCPPNPMCPAPCCPTLIEDCPVSGACAEPIVLNANICGSGDQAADCGDKTSG